MLNCGLQKPQPPARWNGVRDASLEGNYCIQANYFFPFINSLIVGDEDCLFLNVFTPTVSKAQHSPKHVRLLISMVQLKSFWKTCRYLLSELPI